MGSGTTQFGFTARTSFSGSSVASVTFSNGDSFTTSLGLTTSNIFYAFTDTQPFTSATVTFTVGTNYMADFRTAAQAASVPEPATLALVAPGALLFGASAWCRRKAG